MTKLLMLTAVSLSLVGCSESVVFKVNVHDENGSPVTNAVVNIKTLKKLFVGAGSNLNDYRQIVARSDTNGVVAVKFDLVSTDFRYWLTADGYYGCPTRNVHYKMKKDYLYYVTFSEHEKEESVVMRKIKNPIPMYRHCINGAKYLPPENGDFGYDMKIGDWVAPLGKGEIADFYIRKNYDGKARSTKSALFFKGKGNGAYKMKAFMGSEFRSCYSADTNAVFGTLFRYECWTHDYVNPKDGSCKTEICDVDADECLILRTRCRFDEKGNLVSCHYSKVYGKIEIWGWLNFMSCAFNPTPNDPNLEFDVKRNLNKNDSYCTMP